MTSKLTPFAWATHHDEPMLFPTREEAMLHCDDDEEPVALVAAANLEAHGRSEYERGLPKWILTEDQEPAREISVIGFWTPTLGPVHAGCFSTVCLSKYGVWVNPEDDDDEYTQPTHWMPLPPAPIKESRGANEMDEGGA